MLHLLLLSYMPLLAPLLVLVQLEEPAPLAQAPLQARIAQARSYTADPVTLPLAAEQRLNDLMEEA